VKDLAERISAAQTPEIEKMQGWLTQWGAADSSTTMAMVGSMPMDTSIGDMGTDGMMTDAQMQALSTATGSAFDQLWLTGMIAHHQGAIAMAQTEQQSGMNPETLDLADSIVTGQAKEVAGMQKLAPAG